MSVVVSCVLVPGLLCPRCHSARAPPSVTCHQVALVDAACSSSHCPQRVPPARGTSCRRRPRSSFAPALPRCFCVPVTGGGTHPPLFRASSPRPSRLLLCLERHTGSSFARRSEDGTRKCWGVRCVARPLGAAVLQFRVESVWSGFVTACPCHPHPCHRVCPPGWLMSGASPEDTGGSLAGAGPGCAPA